MKKIFKARAGSWFKTSRVQVYGNQLEKIKKKKGLLTANLVLEEAVNKESPLHEVFEWDNGKAATLYRLQQANALISHIDVMIIRDGQEERHQAFVNVVIEEGGKNSHYLRGYLSIEEAMTNDNYRAQVLATAVSELTYWREKYKSYQELEIVFRSISSLQEVFGEKRELQAA